MIPTLRPNGMDTAKTGSMPENIIHQAGLTSAEASRRLAQTGPNSIPESRPHPWLAFLGHLWGPIPWMLEVAVILELI